MQSLPLAIMLTVKKMECQLALLQEESKLTHNTNEDSHVHTNDGDTIFSDRYSKKEKRILT